MKKQPVVLIGFTLLLTFSLYYVNVNSNNSGRRLLNIEVEETVLEGPEITERTCDGIDQTHLVTDEDRQDAHDYLDYTGTAFEGNPILNYMEDGNIEDLGMAIAPYYIAPWLALTILTLLFSFAYCVCSSNCCPWCLCKKRDKEITPYQGMELLWPSFGSFVFLLGAFAACLAGLIHSADLQEAYETTMCGFQMTLNDLNAGIEGSWKGFNGIADHVQALNENIHNLETGVSIFNSDKPWLLTVEGQMLDALQDISDASESGTTSFTVDAEGQSSSYTSQFMTTIFAPQTQTGSWTYIVKAVVEGSVSGLITAMSELQDAGSTMYDGIDLMAEAIDTASESLDGLRTSVDDMQGTLDEQADLGGMALGFVTLALQILFGIGLVVCILGFLGVIFSFVLKKHGCSFLFCLTWLLMVPICILSFIILMITMPLSVASFQLCDMIHQSMNDYAYFSLHKSAMSVDQEFVDFISKCRTNLGGDGEILQEAGIQDDIDAISEMGDQLYLIHELTDPDSVSGQALDSLGDLIDSMNDAIVDSFGTKGYMMTAAESSMTEPQAAQDNVVDTFAAWGESCSDDNTFAWFESDCASGYTYSDASSSFSSSASSNCYLFGDLSQSDFDDYADSCGTNAATMKTKYGYTQDYIAEANAMAEKVVTSSPTDTSQNMVLILKESFNDYDGYTSDFMVDLESFTINCETTIDLVVNPSTGLVSDINCLGVGDSMDTIFDVLCVAFIPALFEISVVIACASCFMFLSMFFLFFASIRFKKAAPSGSTNKQVAHENIIQQDT